MLSQKIFTPLFRKLFFSLSYTMFYVTNKYKYEITHYVYFLSMVFIYIDGIPFIVRGDNIS